MDWTAYMSLSVFVVLVAAELIVSSKRQLALYQRNDTFANIVLGFLTFLSKFALKGMTYVGYVWLYQFAFFEVPVDSLFWIAVAFLMNDLMFYWYHRMAHTTRFFWALHVAHHSSKTLNITTAMRGNFVNHLFHVLFWAPLMLLGFHPLVIITADAFSYFYQLWLHTQIIPKLGPLEYILNTPSHHRVHHGSNPQYIDKNYSAVFIFWDRIFGTFEEEHEEVRYGLTTPFQTNNPLKIAFHEVFAVYRDVRETRGWWAGLREMFRRPGSKK